MQRLKKPHVRDLNKEIKALMGISLRIEKLSGKVLLEKDSDLILRNWKNFLYGTLANYEAGNAPTYPLIDDGGNTRTGYIWKTVGAGSMECKTLIGCFNQGDINVGTNGILIGTGTTAPTRLDYNLQTKITTAEATHQRQTYETLNDYQFRLNREFTSFTVGKNVSEAGLCYVMYESVAYNFYLLRDTFSAVPVSIGNGIRVRYTWSF